MSEVLGSCEETRPKATRRFERMLGWLRNCARLNPLRLWLLNHPSPEISSAVSDLMPEPYDLGGMVLSERWGQPYSSPPRLLVERQLSTNDSGTPVSRSEKHIVTGGEALALYGVAAFERLQSVDEHVYAAIEHLSHQRLDSISDLAHSLSQWHHSVWSGLPNAGINKLAGHVAETYTAQHLESLGMTVQWPAASNQPAWDLLVNGHELNVKLAADALELKAHFARYPDIPVVIPGDSAHVPADAFHLHADSSVHALNQYLNGHHDHAVIVDHGLSHAEIVHQTKEASEAALGITDFHFPWITLAVSGWREARLLHGSKTDLVSAGRNLGLDVAGTGGGALVGAKVGATVGLVVGPVGSAVGGVIGAIAGSIGGRQITESAKRKPLDRAVEAFEGLRLEWIRLSESLNARAQTEYESVKAAEQRWLADEGRREWEMIRSELSQLHAALREMNTLPRELANELLTEMIGTLTRVSAQLVQTLVSKGVIRRWLVPSVETIALEQAIGEIAAAIDAAAGLLSRSTPMSTTVVLGLLAQFGCGRDEVGRVVKDFGARRRSQEAEYLKKLQLAERRQADRRHAALTRLAKSLERITRSLRDKLAPATERVEAAQEEVRREMAKLGYSA